MHACGKNGHAGLPVTHPHAQAALWPRAWGRGDCPKPPPRAPCWRHSVRSVHYRQKSLMGNACARKKRACWLSCDASPRAGRDVARIMGEGGLPKAAAVRAPCWRHSVRSVHYRQKSLMGNACVRKKRACWPSHDVSPRAGRAMALNMGEGGLPKAAAA